MTEFDKEADHAEDRFTQRTSLDKRVLKRLREAAMHANIAGVKPAEYYLDLPLGQGYAVYKPAGKKIVLASILAHNMTPKGTRLPREHFEKTAGAAKRQKTIKGITFKIELEPDDERSGTSSEGKKWSKKMKVCYGYIPKTLGDDGETVDVYLKEDGTFDEIYVVHQNTKDGSHDEDKCMVGFASLKEAVDSYNHHGPPNGFGSADVYSWDDFKDDYLTEHKKEAADADSHLIKIPYFSNFPFASKTYLDQTVNVKVGDHVKKDDPLADSNFTQDGQLALGKNMRVAYLAYYGLNSNDAVVISEAASKKLTSEHMYKEIFDVDQDVALGRELHRQYFGTKYTRAQYAKLDAEGVVKKGTKVDPHDLVIVGVRKGALTPTDVLLGNLKKTLANPYREEMRDWHHDFEGEVIDVYKSEKRVVVTIRTKEPMRIGDKLCYDEQTQMLTIDGWKDVNAITVDDTVATLNTVGQLEYQEPTAVHMYPEGGDMYSVVSQQVDLLVTEQHNMYVKCRDEEEFSLQSAKSILGKRVRYKKNAVWAGEDPNYVVFPALTVTAGQSGHGLRAMPEICMTPTTYAMLLGMYLSEGNLVDQPESGSYGIDITQVKEEHRNKMLRALIEAGIEFNEHSNAQKVRIYSKQLMQHFKMFGLSYQKFIPPEVFNYSAETLRVLFTWLMWGDGHTKDGLPIVYTTTSKQLADDVQRLCLHIGLAANIQSSHKPRQQIKGKWYDCRRRYDVRIVSTKTTPEVNHGHVRSGGHDTLIAEYKQPVYCVTVPNHTVYVRRNGKAVWSGNSGRYGNKGVVSYIIPDNQMIHTKEDKRPVDILYTSAGVISRINPAQIIETSVAKVAEKTGKPIIVENFKGRNNVKWAKELLKEHGLKDKETVHDPISGKDIEGVMVGPQYTLRLFKTTDSNFSARGTGGYDVNRQPTKGGDGGAKGIGAMEFNALVAHNARNVLKETATLKSEKNDEFWRAAQLGLPLPPLKSPFVYEKLMNMIMGAGINPVKSGTMTTLKPMTDADVTKLSRGEVTSEKLVRAKDLAPERGGFFDPAITGGTTGIHWAHFNLAEPIVNPVFMEPARRLLGLSNKEFEAMHYKEGGASIKKKLNAIDVNERLTSLRKDIKTAKASHLDDLVKQIKYLSSLQKSGLKPGDAYVLTKMLVIPPVMRPILPGNGGQETIVGDSNYLYQNAFLHNKELKRQNDNPVLPPDEHAKLRQSLFTAVGAVIGTHETDNQKLEKRSVKGFLEHITGKTNPKSSFFQKKILKKQQDLSGRGTAVPDGGLGMDQIGIPEDMLWTMFGKFIISRLVRRGFGAVAAKDMLEQKHPAARDALLAEISERPVMVNRAPTLHRYNIVGAYAVPVAGKTIRVNPFIEPLQNLDYDGDTLQVHTPALHGAVEDAKKMVLSELLFGDRSKNQLQIAPAMEAILGVHLATQNQMGSGKVHKYKNKEEAMAAYKRGEIKLSDTVEVG